MSLNHSPKIVTNGLVLCLDASDIKSYPKSGTTWFDRSGNGNNGTLINVPTFSSLNAGSLSFSSSRYVEIFTPSSITNNTAISICMWAKWLTIGTDIVNLQVLIDNNHSSNPVRGFVIQDRPDLNQSVTFSTYPNQNGVASTFKVGDGNWHYIVGTNNLSTSTLYIDGIFNNSISQLGIINVQSIISIARWQPGSRYLNGNISQTLMYNKALTAQEVQQNFNATRGRYGI